MSVPVKPLAVQELAEGTCVTILNEAIHDADTTLQLRAIPQSGYYFVQWVATITDESETENDTITIAMTCDKNITAVFAPNSHRPKVYIESSEGGQTTVTPAPPPDGYIPRTEITITASPNEGHMFKGWIGDVTGKNTTIVITANRDKNIIANFAKKTTSPVWWLKNIGIGNGIIVIIGLAFFLIRLIFTRRRISKT